MNDHQTETVNLINDVIFDTNRRDSYQIEAVDNLLDRISDNIRHHNTFDPDVIRNVPIPTAGFGREGYDRDQVDEFLDRLAMRLEESR
ncbi:DivIVA domain-containing protein [Bifidobacterium sp. SO1]|uniref:DivIVA domain-containing protein n=1 Tax=Bifidobacterium sp. SO1 TaxID=2809029 RepID=UPI001BDC1561|nr:DivIVA domain-containing protein [Bifidobacterium sp. SO1]MBT1162164.1 DivIVA domain-containing protein [Bifidobacterium sp. SO1]